MLVYHIANLDEEDMAKRMLVEQETNNWPGLLEEVKGMCEALNLENPTKTTMSKKMYGDAVERACRWKDEALMKAEMEKMKNKKMRTMFHQNLELKEYVKNGMLYSARKTWQVRSYMLDVAGNYTNHSKYKENSWNCQACVLEVLRRSGAPAGVRRLR